MSILSILAKAVVISGVALSLFGLIRGKVVATEMTEPLQISYFGLVLVKFTDPLFYPLNQLVYSNGYNYILPESNTNNMTPSLVSMNIYRFLI